MPSLCRAQAPFDPAEGDGCDGEIARDIPLGEAAQQARLQHLHGPKSLCSGIAEQGLLAPRFALPDPIRELAVSALQIRVLGDPLLQPWQGNPDDCRWFERSCAEGRPVALCREQAL